MNCDIETHFIDSLCIECDACVDICPVDCLTIVKNAEEPDLRGKFRVPADNLEQPVFVSGPLKQTSRVMAKDENVCLHCGLCAERCPTYAWDMRRFVLQIPYAAGAGTVIPLTRSERAHSRAHSQSPKPCSPSPIAHSLCHSP